MELKKEMVKSECAYRLLINLGFSASCAGFFYMAEAIKETSKPGEIHGSLSKKIYPKIAKKYGKTTASVEKACRMSLKKAFREGDREAFMRLLGENYYILKNSPTICEFLSAVKIYLQFPVEVYESDSIELLEKTG